jgi:N-dimethylarginine dimethylaminohydrolase
MQEASSPGREAPVPRRAASEFAAKPAGVLVHDPATTEAFDVLAALPGDELKERTLFSAHPDRTAFSAQHAKLVAAVARAGVDVLRLTDLVPGEGPDALRTNPNHVYTRDSAITLPWLPGWFIGASMRMQIRRREPDVSAAALRALGLRELFAAPSGCFVEGGDVIPLARDGRRSLLVGFGPRTDLGGVDVLSERLMPWALDEIVAVELPPWRMNLDGVLVPVAADTVVAHPGSIARAFLRDARGERAVDVLRLLQAAGMDVIEVSREESMELQACNCLCLGKRRIVCYDLADRVVGALRRCGLEVTALPASELIKGTGGPRCMTRPLYD